MTAPTVSLTLEIPASVAHKLNETFEGTLEDAALLGLRLVHGMGPASHATLNTLATQLNSTPSKVLRSAIKHFAESTDKANMTRATALGRPRVNESRDAKIYAFVRAGATHARAAAEFNLSVVRVAQIVAQHRHLNGDAPMRGRTIPIPTSATPETSAPAQPPAKVQPEPEVLSLKVPDTLDTPSAPRKLAVIPPSMRNPELFPVHRPAEPVDLENLDNRIFEDDFPL